MTLQTDDLAQSILDFLKKADGPLGTREIEAAFPTHSRSKVMFRLKELRAQGLIKGRFISGRSGGQWIWYV